MDQQDLKSGFIKKLATIYPENEAENIYYISLEHATGIDWHKNSLSNISITSIQQDNMNIILNRLLMREPVQYIVNEAWFYDIPFYVDKSVLIPRPETEELAEWVIKENEKLPGISILDVGCGSGCIPVILKRKLPWANVCSCDISNDALEVAKKNAAAHQTKIDFLHLDFLNKKNWALLPRVDIIVSNPPYIPESGKQSLLENVINYEPHTALFVEDRSPFIFYEAIAECGLQILKPGGRIYVEIHSPFAGDIINIFNQHYTTELKKDMQGNNRMIKAVLG